MALGVSSTSNRTNCKPAIFCRRSISRKGASGELSMVSTEPAARRSFIPSRVCRNGKPVGADFVPGPEIKFRAARQGVGGHGMGHDQPLGSRARQKRARPARSTSFHLYVVHQHLIIRGRARAHFSERVMIEHVGYSVARFHHDQADGAGFEIAAILARSKCGD
jgi:hypothetical protein